MAGSRPCARGDPAPGHPLIQERLGLLSEALEKLAFLFVADEDLRFEPDAVAALGNDAPALLDASLDVLETLPTWDHQAVEAALRARLVGELGARPRVAFAAVRVGVTGSRVSPPLFESMAVLGRASSLARLRALRDRL